MDWLNLEQGLRGFVVTFDVVRFCIGLGLVFRMEWIMFLAKIVMYVSLLLSSYMLMITFFSGLYLEAALVLMQLALTGFMIYLINYVGD